MNVLLDTSVLIDFLRGVDPARERLREAIAADGVVAASVLTRIELSVGMRAGEREATDALVAALRWLPVDEDVASEADQLARAHARAHSGIDAVDYCIAATARLHGLELWTHNVRHFPMFESLRPPW